MAIDFNATTTVIDCRSTPLLNDAQPFTFCAWIAPEDLGEGSSGVIVNKDATQNANRWTFAINSGGAQGARLRFQKKYTTADLLIFTTDIISTNGTFTHVALTWNGSNRASDVAIYAGGTEATYFSTQTGAGPVTSDAPLPFIFGNNATATRTFDGRIAQPHFYRRVLTRGEIASLARFPASLRMVGSVSAIGTVGCIGFWPFEVGSYPADHSGNMHNATSTTAITYITYLTGNTSGYPQNQNYNQFSPCTVCCV